jgi:hypothetical protein
MLEYTHPLGLELQARAFNGDVDACMQLMEWVRPFAVAHMRGSTLPKDLVRDLWHDTVLVLSTRIAGGNFWERWRPCGYMVARRVLFDHFKSDKARIKRESNYMDAQDTRVRDAYPALHACVRELEPLQHDLVQRMYFRPVRQNKIEFSLEYGMNYWSVRNLHWDALDALRVLLAARGIMHA